MVCDRWPSEGQKKVKGQKKPNIISVMLSFNPCLTGCGTGYNLHQKTRLLLDKDSPTYFVIEYTYHRFEDNVENIFESKKTLVDAALENKATFELAKTLVCLSCPYARDSEAEDQDEFRRWLVEYDTRPQSLANICRSFLRKRLPSGIQFHRALESLELPSVLNNFLKAEHV
jgi:hypothetical protein